MELIVDSFAGGGGASTGIEMALGRSPDLAINHDADAIRMHAANHPRTRHLNANIYRVDPLDHVRRGSVGLAWFSPDCKHHSKAKGSAPVKRNIRDLAWVVVSWAERARPRVIMLENVEEFEDWGPVLWDETLNRGRGGWRPDPGRKGETFAKWVRRLRGLGYSVQWRQLRACDYGAPTIRKRLFVIARCDGRPIVWPKLTHGSPADPRVLAGELLPWRTAAEIIDWSLPCPSIFDTAEEIMRKHGLRAVRPLAEATMRRIARGVVRYVLQAERPFIVTCNHAGDGFRGQSIDEPLLTVTATRDATGIVVPNLIRTDMHSAADRNGVYGPEEPLRTVMTSGAFAAVVPTLIQAGYGERDGQQPRVPGLEVPLGTVVAGGCKHALVAAYLAQHNTDMVGHDAREPVSTIVQKGCTQAVVAAHLMTMKGSDRRDAPADAPLRTLCAGGGHAALIAPFLTKYYGQGVGAAADEPMHTVTTLDRFGLVTVSIDGVPHAIADIGMRMLVPRELYRAQGFPEGYIIDRDADGRPFGKTSQIRMAGNSVCPPLAEAIVSANCADMAVGAAEEAVA